MHSIHRNASKATPKFIKIIGAPFYPCPHWLEILAEGDGEVVNDDERRHAVVEPKEEGLLA